MYQQPIVKFGKTLINLAHVEYVRVSKDESGYHVKWKLTIQLRDHSLWWTYDTEDAAREALDKFEALNETYMMSELP
jgi:hypothetical protein